MIPGLQRTFIGGGFSLLYSASTTDVDLWADAGSPARAVSVLVIIGAGVEISATETGTPAMDGSGFAAGSEIFLINNGSILGAAGDGGLSLVLGAGGNTVTINGCGGGGAGTIAGLGANPFPLAAGTGGADGDREFGGAGGGRNTTTGPVDDPVDGNYDLYDGAPGGIALNLGATSIEIQNVNGEIWGGGGGGGGSSARGQWTGPWDGGNGGDPGIDGGEGIPTLQQQLDQDPQNIPDRLQSGLGGIAGEAIKGTGTITFRSGELDPNVKGVVGP